MALLQQDPGSPYDNYEFGHLQSPPFPHTPSYNGSYQNSPYSAHSDLSFDPGEYGEGYGLGDDQAGIMHQEDYDPSDYDAPNTGLLMFNGDFISGSDAPAVSVTPAAPDHHSPAFDYSSPSSTGGGENDGHTRSRASSISSNHPRPMASPRLDVTRSFENMRFESPHWSSGQLPVDRGTSPPRKPQSPPTLFIPESSPSNRPMYQHEPPVINAPDGDGGFMSSGPQLHIVPATPVSGGGATSQAVPFQQTLETLHQGSVQNGQVASPPWDQQQIQQTPEISQSLGLSRYPEQSAQPQSIPYPFNTQHGHTASSQGLSTAGPQVHPDSTNNNLLFLNIPPRSRSKSDTASSIKPLWNQGFNMSHEQLAAAMNESALDDTNTVNLSDVLPQQHQHQQSPYMGGQQHPSSAGANQSSFNMNPMQQQSFYNPSPMNGFLSPDVGQLRRSRSDGGSRPTHTRLSRSEDFTSSALMFPPSSQQDFIKSQFLHPSLDGPIPSIRGSHIRRGSSGSRSGLSSNRPSPYPSPSASPQVYHEDLPNVSITGHPPSMLRSDVAQQGGSLVSKPNVTSERTAGASHRRRKQEANFLCPVPGCGSTFTRSFNLKGHMRSHNEERPFQCKWPGCGKGFARQHDCKRHEQLHSNYRPFTCDGCNKNFARMDALNRHLRSEGGAECQRMIDANKDASGVGTSGLKTEESNWGMSVMV